MRPFAIGGVLRRLVRKAVARTFAKRVRQATEPYQYAVGLQGGAETLHKTVVAHLARDPAALQLNVDIRNAHGAVEWQAVLEATREAIPEMLPWVAPIFAATAPLGCDMGADGILRMAARRGLGQGCPMSGQLFPVTTHGALKGAAERMSVVDPSARIYAYQDDIILVGSAAAIREGIAFLRAALRTRGLEMRADKCELYAPAVADTQAQELAQALGVKRVDVPTVFRLDAQLGDPDRVPTTQAQDSEATLLMASSSLVVAKIIDQRRAYCARLLALAGAGLPVAIAQALLRDQTSSDTSS